MQPTEHYHSPLYSPYSSAPCYLCLYERHASAVYRRPSWAMPERTSESHLKYSVGSMLGMSPHAGSRHLPIGYWVPHSSMHPQDWPRRPMGSLGGSERDRDNEEEESSNTKMVSKGEGRVRRDRLELNIQV